jgi:putative ABC transport system ATP-binding protein
MSSIIKLENIIKKFYVGEPNELEILHGISLEVEEGEFVAIVGPSGSGKSTLMNTIGVLDRPTSGTYMLDGINVGEAEESELSEIRNQKIGFVFQTYNLISKTNALKNIELPMLYAGMERSERLKRAKELLDLVEMGDRAKHLPEELSGGQKQRVAIARAMANDPAIILADEPTGALDSKTGRLVMDLFHKLNKEKNKTIVLITHSNELAGETDRIISIRDGKIISVKDNSKNKEKNIAKNRTINTAEETVEVELDEKEKNENNTQKQEKSSEEKNTNEKKKNKSKKNEGGKN